MLTKKRYSHSDNYLKYFEYSCSCGKDILARETHVLSGGIMSCGCIRSSRRDYIERRRVEYNTWKRIRQRCNNKNHPRYDDWGGRGIEVCERWSIFDNFFYDMGFRPVGKYSIERVDNNKGYSAENCIWATIDEQSINKRVYRKSKTGVSGVELMKGNKYKSSARVHGVLHHLGTFDNLLDAVCVRKSFKNKRIK